MFKGHPKGLIAAALSNMGERFGYYIMNAVLTLFLCSKFGLSDHTAGIIYACFYFSIYIMALPGGIIADKLQNFKGTIIAGLLTMVLGYAILSVPAGYGATSMSMSTVLVITCVALLIIAFGNGLFKGNLQAIVGQMYDNYEAEAAKKGPAALAEAQSKRDPGFQIFYMFINVGGLIAPFVAPLLRSWWLGVKGMTYESTLPKLCHMYLDPNVTMTPEQTANLTTLMEQVNKGGLDLGDMGAACSSYLEVFNTGVHYSFLASIAAMLISLTIFLCTKKGMPNPQKKAVAAEGAKNEEATLTQEERAAALKDVKQRMAGLYAVLGVCVFFWMSFHQNGESLSLFARDFVNTSSIPPEIFQCINPFFVIVLTFPIMWIFNTKWGRKFSTPAKIAMGMGITACAYIFLMAFSLVKGYPSGDGFMELTLDQQTGMKAGPWVLIVTYFCLTVAELFISPLGISFVSKIAPKHIQGICQGLWLGATGIGNALIMLGPIFYSKLPKLWMCWAVFMVICLIAMCIMIGMLKWLERITAQQQ